MNRELERSSIGGLLSHLKLGDLTPLICASRVSPRLQLFPGIAKSCCCVFALKSRLSIYHRRPSLSGCYALGSGCPMPDKFVFSHRPLRRSGAN